MWFGRKKFVIKCMPCLLMALFFLINVTGCTKIQSQAPVQPKQRDLINGSYYTIKKGDTLYSVGFRSGHGYKRLASWNKISPPYNIYIGQKLKLFKKKSAKRPKVKKKSSTISVNNKKVLKFNWRWPVRGKILRGFYLTGRKGIDISGYVGQNIKATEAGVVVYSGSGLVGYGKLLIIKHNYLYLSAYAHNRRLLVKEGQKVKAGQHIAEMGVGANAEPSLHFEIRKNGTPVNPVTYLSK
ncbi:MAG: peptidoglycan DD-metalloendopeptidase family protein [Methyloprofundus sp.]|nr:peptidoglycan DD-metalloendopeptidase family protein [Methyloprofundus sp.]